MWVYYAFNEDKAHRIGFYLSNQCKKLIVVYCNPVYTRHHRCTYEQTSVISLYEFAELASPKARMKYSPQILFLQNNLRIQNEEPLEDIYTLILFPEKQWYPISEPELREALAVVKTMPISDFDLLYYLCAINLVNAWIGDNRKGNQHENKRRIIKKLYHFKSHVASTLEQLINNSFVNTKIYIRGNLILIDQFGFQFSFHNIPKTNVIATFEISEKNIPIVWSGKRLQPVAPLLLNYARKLRQLKNTTT